MRILIAGVCGFAGSTLARTWIESAAGHELIGIDSFARPGSEVNRLALRELGVDQFAVYLQHDGQDETLTAYGERILPVAG